MCLHVLRVLGLSTTASVSERALVRANTTLYGKYFLCFEQKFEFFVRCSSPDSYTIGKIAFKKVIQISCVTLPVGAPPPPPFPRSVANCAPPSKICCPKEKRKKVGYFFCAPFQLFAPLWNKSGTPKKICSGRPNAKLDREIHK